MTAKILETIEILNTKTDLKFEVIDNIVYPKEGSEPFPQEIIDYILSENFDLEYFFKTYDMPRTSINHRKIIANLNEMLIQTINLSEFRVYINDMVVTRKLFGFFYVPDITVTLKKNEIYDTEGALENPISIIEILSPSTEKKDKNQKKKDYQSIASLQEYILISQNSYKITQFLREGKTDWIMKIYDQENQTCLMTVGVKIDLKKLYKDIDFNCMK